MAKRKKGVVLEGNAYTKAASAERNITTGRVIEQPPEPVAESEMTSFPDVYPRECIRIMTDDEIARITEALLLTMTFSEKCELLHSGYTVPETTGFSSYVSGIPRLGVPAMIQHDGPSGCNSIHETTNLPVGLVAGCTFEPEMARNYGRVLGEELVSIGSNWQLGCQFDLTRHPFWMRSRDTFGEDYYLTGEMAVAETAGVQEAGAGAMAKHMGAYCTNGDNLLSEEVDEQTLHTAYLHPFEQASVRSRLASIMTSYTRLNGYYSASHTYMQKDVARSMWGWNGNITTDAGGNQEVSVHLGTDNEMLCQYNDEAHIRSYINAGLMTMDDVDTAVRHILWGYGVAGYLGLVEIDPLTKRAKYEPGRVDDILFPDTYEEDRAAGLMKQHHDLAVEIAEKGIVLLKNDDALPLTEKKLNEGVALIGYGAKHNTQGTGFERSFGVLEHMRSPQEALEEIVSGTVVTEVMDDRLGYTIEGDYLFVDETCETQGLVRTYGIQKEDYYIPRFTGLPGMPPAEDGEDAPPPPPGFGPKEPVEVEMPGYQTGEIAAVDSEIEFICHNRQFKGGNAFSRGSAYTWKGYVKAPEAGEYLFALHAIGGDADFRLYDGEQELSAIHIQNMGFGHGAHWEYDEPTPEGMSAVRKPVQLEAGKRYRIMVTAQALYEEKDLSLRLAWITPSRKKADYEAAITAAKTYPTVIYFAREGVLGHGGMNFTKPGLEVNDLDSLLAVQKAAKDAGNKFIVVMHSRSAFSLDGDWCKNTDGLIACFYPGQGGNQALANLLTGKTNFSGKLCLTIPNRTEDTCVSCSEALSDERRGHIVDMRTEITAKFTEKLDFGYRWNERMGIKPGFAFGHGLSYTTFAYSDTSVERTDAGLAVCVTIENVGNIVGDEIVQVYIGPGKAGEHIFFAKKQLCGFARSGNLAPGEKKQVEILIPYRMLCAWDIKAPITKQPDGTKGKWVLVQGERSIMVGAASDDIREEVTVSI